MSTHCPRAADPNVAARYRARFETSTGGMSKDTHHFPPPTPSRITTDRHMLRRAFLFPSP